MAVYSRLFWTLFFACTLVFTACSGDEGDETDSTGGETDLATGDTGDDAGNSDAISSDSGDECNGGTVCALNSACSADEYCDNGCCVARTVTPICAQAGDECEGASWSNDNFFCEVPVGETVGICLARCDADSRTSADANSCPSGSYCFEIDDSITTASGYFLDGACSEGDCNDSCFEVGGACAEEDLFTCFEGTGTCYAIGNSSSFCVGAGTAVEGEACESGVIATGEGCAPGLFCYQDVCASPCSYSDADPVGGCDSGECIQVFDGTADNNPGVCTSGCTAYSGDECGDTAGCTANIGVFSGTVTAWSCLDFAADVELVGYLEECDADASDGLDSQCSEGLDCEPSPLEDGLGTCHQHCDPLLDSEEAFGACPTGAGGDFIYADSFDGSDFTSIDPVSYGSLIAVNDAGGTFSSGSANFAGNTASTVLAMGNADSGYSLADETEIDDETETPEAAALWIYNYTDDDVTAYGSDDSAGEDTELQTTLWVNGIGVELEDDEAAYRVMNGSSEHASIFVDGTDEDATVGFGAASDWMIAGEGMVMLDILDEEGGELLDASMVELVAGDVTTLVVFWGDGPSGETLRSSEVAGVDDDDDGVLGVTIAGNIVSSITASELGDVDSGDVEGFDLDEGTFTLVIIAEDSAAGSPAADAMDFTDLDDEEIASAFLTNDGNASFVSDWPELDEDEAFFRFINLTDSDLQLEYPGESSEVCVDWESFGLESGQLGICMYECSPFLDESAADESGESTGRWEGNGCPHTDDVVYGCLGYLTTNNNEILYEEDGDPDLTGFCLPRAEADATGDFDDSCATNGDGDCNPDSWCVEFEAGNPTCNKLCSPFSGDRSSDCLDGDYCLATFDQTWSFCIPGEDAVSAGEGEACNSADEYFGCEADDSFCLCLSTTSCECIRLCKVGVEESCSVDSRGDCSRDNLNPDLDPQWVGICGGL
jgi:hypothetical protein